MKKDTNSTSGPSTSEFQADTEERFCPGCGCPVFSMFGGLVFHDETKSTPEQLKNCEIYNPLWYRELCKFFTHPDDSGQ